MTLLPFPVRPEWWKDAQCKGLPLGVFFNGGPQDMALAVCAQCSVKEACLEDAIEYESALTLRYVEGVRGGKTAKERRAIIRASGKVAPTHNAPQPCPSEAAYQRHRRHGEEACEGCKEKHRLHTAAWRNGGTVPEKRAVVNQREMVGPAARWGVLRVVS